MRLSHNSDRDRYRRVSVGLASSRRKLRGTFLAWTHDHRSALVELDPRRGCWRVTREAVAGFMVNLARAEREPSPKARENDSARPLLRALE